MSTVSCKVAGAGFKGRSGSKSPHMMELGSNSHYRYGI